MTPKKLFVLITMVWIAFIAVCVWWEYSEDGPAKVFNGTIFENWVKERDEAPVAEFTDSSQKVGYPEAAFDPPTDAPRPRVVPPAPGKTVRGLVFYDSNKGFQFFEFATRKFKSIGKPTSSDPEQPIRALQFAVNLEDQSIVAGDSQSIGYPLYTFDLKQMRLEKVGHADGFLYQSLSYNPKNGFLYGTTWEGPHRDEIVIVSPETGAIQKLDPTITGARIAHAPNGKLYAMISGGYLSGDAENGQIYLMNIDTAKHQLIGKVELDYESTSFTIGPDGMGYVLEHTGKLRLVNLDTMEQSYLGDSGCRSAFGLFVYEVPVSLLKN